MDKDTICEERGICPKYYGKDTIIFISIHDNCSESLRRRWGWNSKDKMLKIKPHNKQNRDVKNKSMAIFKQNYGVLRNQRNQERSF